MAPEGQMPSQPLQNTTQEFGLMIVVFLPVSSWILKAFM